MTKRSIAKDLAASPAIGKELEVKKLKAQIAARDAQYQAALAEIEELQGSLDVLAGVRNGEPVKPPKPRKEPAGESAACVVLTDWHCDQTVDPETLDKPNTYNPDIFSERCQRVFQKAVSFLAFARHLSDVDELVVAILGDCWGGYIHDELVEGNSIGPTEAFALASDHIEGGVDYLLEHCNVKRLRVVCCKGNHPRMTHKIRHATGHRTNLEWLMYTRLAKRFAQKKSPVEWHVAKGYFNRQAVKGWQVRFHHGNNVRYQGGVGGVTIPLNKAIAQWNKSRHADYDVMGHWHQFLRLRNAVLCNCLVGYDAFAESIKAEYAEPSQTFLAFDRRRGLWLAEELFVTE